MIKYSRHVVAAMLAVPATSFALGVGDIEWQSKLNEPLRATIELIYGDSEEALSATAQLASPEDFARVGLDRSQVEVPLSFEVQRNDQGNFVIVVTSQESVEEPFLNFLVEVEWDNGRLLREYVVLLDPPVTAPASNVVDVTPIPDEPAVRDTADDVPPSTQPATTTPSTSTQRPSTPRYAGDEEYGPVARGETLWEIARDTRPSSEITINQMMVLLLELNPDAFYEQNVNALREGAILRIPDSSDAQGMPAGTANARVEEFNELWNIYAQQARLAQVPTVSDAGADSQYTADEPIRRPERDDSRLELVPPAGTSDTSRDRPGAGDANADALRSDLARTREDLITARQENRELLDRVTELEDLIDSYEQTIDLKDANFAELQQQLREARENAGLDASTDASTDPFAVADTDSGFRDDAMMDDTQSDMADTSTDPFALDTSSAVDDATSDTTTDPFGASSTVDDDTADTGANRTDSEDATTADPQPAVESTVQREPKSGFDTKFIAMIVLLVCLLAAGGIGFFLWRRRKNNADDDAVGFELIDDDDDLEPDLEAAGAELEDDLDERETQLREALAADPSDPQNHLALLRRHYAANDEDRFIAAAERMRESVGDDHPAWMEVRAMGANIAPNAAVFGESGGDASMQSTRMLDRTSEEELDLRLRPTADDDTDLDIDLDLGDDDDLDIGGSESDMDDDLDLDLDLGDDEGGSDAEPQTDEFSLDLDLDESAVDDDDLDLDLDFGDEESSAGASDDDLDLDLDLDLDGPTDDAAGPPADDLDLDLDFGDDSSGSASDDDLGLDLDDLNLDEEPAAETSDHTEFELEALDTEDTADKDTAELSLDDLGDLDDLGLDDDAPAASGGGDDLGLDLDDDGDLSLDDLDLGDSGGDDDAVATKLDLAKAYIEMGDPDGAKGMLEEVMSEGNDGQKAEAQGLLDGL